MTRLAVGLSILAVVVGCGIQIDPEPRVYDEDEQAAIEAALDPPAAVLPDESGGALVDLYFVTGNRLASVRRSVAGTDPQSVVEALIEGPGAVEEGLDLRSAIPPATQVRSVVVTDGIARVDISRDFAVVGGEEEILAVAQVVVTLAASPEIDGVVFALGGVDTAVPRADGALIDRPLDLADFRLLVVEEE